MVVLSVSTDVPFASGLGLGLLKVAVTPGGNPLTESVTLFPNGSVPTVESAMLYTTLLPAETACEVGLTLPVKSTVPTSNVNVVARESKPLCPATAMV